MTNVKKTERSHEILELKSREETLVNLLAPVAPTPKPGLDLNLNTPPKIPPVDQRKTFKLESSSDLLSRVKSFLPQLATANEQLQQQVVQDPKKVDIENVGEDEEQYIEMNLGLGVYEVKEKNNMEEGDIGNIIMDPNADPERAKPSIIMLNQSDDDEDSDDEDENEEDDDDDEQDEDEDGDESENQVEDEDESMDEKAG